MILSEGPGIAAAHAVQAGTAVQHAPYSGLLPALNEGKQLLEVADIEPGYVGQLRCESRLSSMSCSRQAPTTASRSGTVRPGPCDLGAVQGLARLERREREVGNPDHVDRP